MARLSPNEVTQSDIDAYLATEDDFAFELSIFKACIDSGLKAEHGGTYQDSVTKKDRQFDIRARVSEGKFTVRFAIECKNLQRNFPLLVSRVPMASSEKFHDVIISGEKHGAPSLANLDSTNTVRMTGNFSMFMTDDYVGKATTQVGRSSSGDFVDGDTEVFEKWAQAVASASDLIAEATDDYKLLNHDCAGTVILPILVLPDQMLWIADYATNGTLVESAKRIDHCLIYLGKEVFTPAFLTEYKFSHLQLFTKSRFASYLRTFGRGEISWDTLFNDRKMNKAFEAFQDS